MLKRIFIVCMLIAVSSFGITPSAAAPICVGNYALRSVENSKYVSVELGYSGSDYGMLRARAGTVGPWEQFILCDYTSYYTLQSQANGKYVSVELGYSGNNYGMLRARADTVGPWEMFTYSVVNNLKSQANYDYVSAELGYPVNDYRYGMLRARSLAIGPWEIFSYRGY